MMSYTSSTSDFTKEDYHGNNKSKKTEKIRNAFKKLRKKRLRQRSQTPKDDDKKRKIHCKNSNSRSSKSSGEKQESFTRKRNIYRITSSSSLNYSEDDIQVFNKEKEQGSHQNFQDESENIQNDADNTQNKAGSIQNEAGSTQNEAESIKDETERIHNETEMDSDLNTKISLNNMERNMNTRRRIACITTSSFSSDDSKVGSEEENQVDNNTFQEELENIQKIGESIHNKADNNSKTPPIVYTRSRNSPKNRNSRYKVIKNVSTRTSTSIEIGRKRSLQEILGKSDQEESNISENKYLQKQKSQVVADTDSDNDIEEFINKKSGPTTKSMRKTRHSTIKSTKELLNDLENDDSSDEFITVNNNASRRRSGSSSKNKNTRNKLKINQTTQIENEKFARTFNLNNTCVNQYLFTYLREVDECYRQIRQYLNMIKEAKTKLKRTLKQLH